MGIIAGPVEASGLQVMHFSTDRLVLIVPACHELSSCKTVSLKQTLDFQHIGLHDGSTLLSFLRDHVERMGLNLSLRVQLSSFEEAGVGMGIIPESAALRHSQTMNLVTINLDEPWAVRERSSLVRELEALPGTVRALIATLMPGPAGAGSVAPAAPN